MTVVGASTARTPAEQRILDLLRTPRRVLLVTVPLLALVLVGVVIYTGGRHIDLQVYRFGVQAWLSGGGLYGPLPQTAAHIALPFIYPPFAALAMIPLAVVPWVVAWTGLLALSTLSLGATLYVVARRLWEAGGRAGALSVASIALPLALAVEPGKIIDFNAPDASPRPPLSLEPVSQTIQFGQINLLLMALVAIDCLVARPRWPRGMLVGIAAAIKLTPAAFVLYFLLRRDYRSAATAAVSGAVATADRVRRGTRPVVDVLAGQSGGRRQRFAVLHEPDVRGRARAGARRRLRAHHLLAVAVRRAARTRGAGDPAWFRAARARRHGRCRAAGVAHLLVAPLGVGGARPAGRRRHGVAGEVAGRGRRSPSRWGRCS